MNVIAGMLLVLGAVFLTTGTIGYVRLPDFFSRMHAIGKSDTLGAALSLGGIACFAGWSLLALKLLLVAAFIFLANPTATHALGRAAVRRGVVPWTKSGMR